MVRYYGVRPTHQRVVLSAASDWVSYITVFTSSLCRLMKILFPLYFIAQCLNRSYIHTDLPRDLYRIVPYCECCKFFRMICTNWVLVILWYYIRLYFLYLCYIIVSIVFWKCHCNCLCTWLVENMLDTFFVRFSGIVVCIGYCILWCKYTLYTICMLNMLWYIYFITYIEAVIYFTCGVHETSVFVINYFPIIL